MEQEKNKTAPVAQPHKRSIGEKIFDWTTYGGLAGVATFVLTIPVAWMFKHGPLKPHYDNAAVWVRDKGLRFLPESWRPHVVQHGLMTAILMQGGNLMLWPISKMEQNKKRIVHGLNVMFDDKTDPRTIEEVPEQTVGSLIKGRTMAFCAVFASILTFGLTFKGTMKTFETEFGEHTNRLFRKSKNARGTAFQFGELAAVDLFATAAAATLLYVGSHFFAKKQVEKKIGTHGITGARHAEEAPLLETSAAPAAANDDTPSPKVSSITRDANTVVAKAPALENAIA